jgi:hypothetical protein
LTAIICAACGLAFFAQPAWAQTVPPAARPVIAAPPPARIAPAAIAPIAAVAPAPIAPAAIAPIAAPPPALAAPAALAPVAPVIADQAPPAPPAPPQVPKPAKPPAVPEAAPTPPESPSSNMNVRVEVTITDQSGSSAPTKKTVSLTVSDEGRGSVRSGVTVPIPNMTYMPIPSPGKDAAPAQPMTSYNYRDMGLSLDVTNLRIRGNYVRLRLAVEYNPVDEKMASAEGAAASTSGQAPASFARFSQTLDLSLENGKPLVVASSSDPVPSRNRTASLEVKATILK